MKFKDIGHEPWFYWYVSAGIAVSLLVYLWMPETRTTLLIDRDGVEPNPEIQAQTTGT